ncbi:MAG: aspartate kinase [Eubacterium sp.]|nr:aspartate kinase [Candidatus Colimonas fimequi]
MDKIKAVAKHIAATKQDGDGLVIVVSAMGETTDKLIALAKEAGTDLKKSELDMLLATGDQQTVALLAIALQAEGVDAQAVPLLASNVALDNPYATVKGLNTGLIEQVVVGGKVAVVSGFQGISEDGNLKSGNGSDVTAVGIAAQLEWDCEIYSESECMYTVDPEIYPQAKPISAITYEEMMEVANLGADKIETAAVELAKRYNVKIYFGKALSNDKSKGTYIVNKQLMANQNLLVEDTPITGMGIQDEVSIFTLRGIPADGKAVAEAFRILGELGIVVDMISQQMAADGTCTVSFSCDSESGDKLEAALNAEDVFNGIEINREANLAMISLVGVGMATHSGVSGKVFRVLAENGVRYYHITTSEISISVTVEMEQKLSAAIALCREFNL